MKKLVEIGGLIKKGLGQTVVKKFSKNKDVISVGYANGRASDMFDIQQFGNASEADILTLIVNEKKSEYNLWRSLQSSKAIIPKKWYNFQIRYNCKVYRKIVF